jgi:bifunctional non-homologous end joining protein LigD
MLVAFDLLHLDGEDMRGRELEDRRAVLEAVVRKPRRRLLGEYFSGGRPCALSPR